MMWARRLLLVWSAVLGATTRSLECEEWAAAGECLANPRFMLTQCAEACYAALGAREGHPECGAWAEADECTKNRAFMQLECARVCGQQWRWVPSVRRALGLEPSVVAESALEAAAPAAELAGDELSVDAHAAAMDAVGLLVELVTRGRRPKGSSLPEDDGFLVAASCTTLAYAARLFRDDDLAAFAEAALVDDPRRIDWALRRLPEVLATVEAPPPRRVVVRDGPRASPARTTVQLKYAKIRMPLVGLGTCWLSEAETETALEAVVAAVESFGVKRHPGVHVDSAEAYRNEAAIGKVLRRTSAATKAKLFLASKLSSEEALASYEAARSRVAETRRAFGVDFVHLYSLHSPFAFRSSDDRRRRLRVAWRALVDAVKDGEILALGLSNFDEAELRDFAADPGLGGLRMPDVLQNKFDLYRPGEQVTTAPGDPRHALADLGMTLVAYSTLSGWPYAAGPALADPLVAQLAKRRAISPAQLILRWALDSGAAVIPRSKSPDRVQENLRVIHLPPLDPRELALLNSIPRLVASARNEPPADAPDVFHLATQEL